MTNPWESLCRDLATGPTCSLPQRSCFNSVKIHGLTSVKSGFIPDERLLACKTCGVIFLHDKTESHYDAFHECLSKDTSKPDLLPYHAVNLCQKIYEAAQLEEKLAHKRLKTGSIRKSKSLRVLSHANHFGDSSVTSTSDRQRKRTTLKSRTSGDSPSVCNSLDRDKLSSSSSCDRLSHSGVNSPDSPGTESSSSAPSKLIENPPDLPSIYPRKGLMEILQEESASLVSRTRRICGNPSKPVPSHPLCRSSISSLSVSHSQSYPSSPSSPSLGDRKESISISQSVHSIRKQVPVTTMQPASAELSQVRSNKQSPAEVQIHSRLRSQFETYLPHSSSFRHQHVVRQTPTSTVPIKGVETVSLISNDGPDTDVEMPHGFSAGDESVAAVYHLEQDSRTQFGRSQQIRSNRPSRNGSKASLPSYLRAAQNEKQWNASNFVAASGNWSKNSHLQVTQPNYYNALFDADSLRPHKSEQRPFNSDFGVYGKALRNPSEKSVNQQHGVIGRSANEDSERLHREILHSDTVINSLTQCGCVEMDDLRCKNSILCTVHTMEEKRRVPRPRDLKSLIREARQQQQHLLRLHESPIPTKVRRISSTAVSSKSTPPVPLLTSSSAPRTATPPVVTSAHRLAAFPASTTARRISVNGVITTVDGQPSATIQQPTILHRRVHHPSSLLRRNQQMWVGGVGQEKTSTSFISTTAASPGYYASPSPTALSKLAQEPAKLSDSREVQSRVVVNDDREKSITGRSRKSSRSGLRQPPSSLHNAYIQHITPSPTHTNSTALLLRASAANQIAAKLRGAAARDSATTAASWIGYGRGGTSDVQLAVSASSSTSSTASRHSNPSATAIAAKAANTHAFGSNRYILIGTKPLRKSVSSSRLTVVPGINILQTHHHPHQTPSTASASSSSSNLATKQLVESIPEATSTATVDLTDPDAEAAAAASVIAGAASSNDEDVNCVGIQLDFQQHQQFGRSVAATSGTTSTAAAGVPANLRQSPCSVPAGQMFVFQTRRL